MNQNEREVLTQTLELYCGQQESLPVLAVMILSGRLMVVQFVVRSPELLMVVRLPVLFVMISPGMLLSVTVLFVMLLLVLSGVILPGVRLVLPVVSAVISPGMWLRKMPSVPL